MKAELDQWWPRLTTGAVAAVNVPAAGGNCPTVGGRKRRRPEEERVHQKNTKSFFACF